MKPPPLVVLALAGLWLGSAVAAETGSESPSLLGGWTVPWPPLKELKATRDRPLFAPDRRHVTPPSKPAQVRQEAVKPRPQFRLTGIIVEDSATFAVLKDLTLDESKVVRSGDKIGEWLVTVGADRIVTLACEREQITLRMFDGDGDNSE
jgi:hypothetical protein